MSFYGQVFYELSDAIAKIIVKKAADDKSPVELKAVGTGGGITMEPMNNWITLGGNPNNYTLQIGHSTVGTGQTITPFKRVSAASGATQLAAADTIAIQKFKYDNAGHVTTDGIEYYKLPISEAEINIANLQSRMEQLEDSEDDQLERLGNVESLVSSYETRVSDLETISNSNSDTIEDHTIHLNNLDQTDQKFETDIQDLDNLLGNRSDISKNSQATVTAIIGPTDELLKNFNCKNLSECINKTMSEINSSNSLIGNNAIAMKLALKNLCQVLNDNGIIVDYDALWDV